MKKILLFLLILLVYLAHQDLWNWKASEPLVLGFLPVGLAYHAGYSVLCALLMAVLVKWAWPKELEAQDHKAEDSVGVRQSSSASPLLCGSLPAGGGEERARITRS
jgi:uncharacterized oligopeptide transporter (OPT) family protein